jgi:hypothetical protein
MFMQLEYKPAVAEFSLNKIPKTKKKKKINSV